MTKSMFDGKIETTITAEKDTGIKRNSVNLWPKYAYFISQACDFLLEKASMPEMNIFYVNQASLSYKDNKIYYADLYILGQVVPMLNPPEDLENYVPKPKEAKLIRPKYDSISGELFGPRTNSRLSNCPRRGSGVFLRLWIQQRKQKMTLQYTQDKDS